MQLRLHARYQNSAGQRVRIVLNLKDLAYTYVPVSKASDPAYLAINPQGLLPTLEVDGRFIAQSMAIVELIEELHPDPSVMPADPIRRAQMRAFADLICADLHPLNNLRVRRYLSGTMGAGEQAIAGWYAHWVAVTFSALEQSIARNDGAFRYCFADHPTVADACLVPQIDNARRFDCDLSPYPRLLQIDRRCRELEAFQRAAPEQQVDFPGT
ncbi:MAG: maleylacetoacetate isomerase [Minwuia sp.]|nr:maleylacetoacetate isomerase [Minwuia sp.]